MKTKSLFLSILALAGACSTMSGASVKVTMNNISKTMSLVSTTTNEPVEVGEPNNLDYTIELPADTYRLTAYATDGTTVNGTIDINVTDADDQVFKLITCTVYATNKNEDGSVWTAEAGDYTLDVKVNSREGVNFPITVGESTTAGRNTFLALNGNSYYVNFNPSEAHRAEGYTNLYRSGTLTANVNISGIIPQGADYTVTVPSDAYFELNMKFSHFIDFTPIVPVSVTTEGAATKYTYFLANGQVYNYRTSMDGKMTQGGYFAMNTDETKRPNLNFTEADYEGDPKHINPTPQSNDGYETGNIFMNINAQGHLRLNQGDKFNTHAMRSWELTDNSTNNYFIEPDFHYTVIGLDGKPSDNVIKITEKKGSAWAEMEATGTGEAIVLVTYDGIRLNYYNGAEKRAYLGGEQWGAIWPENTAAFVVSVGDGESAVKPNMTINEEYNKETLKTAGKYVDAECDVFYYLDTEEGFPYTFTPENAAEVTIAYPTIGEQMATYSGFSADGVTKNEDGSYTVLLKHGRQIVKLTDAAGKSAYQVMTAKMCHREIINATREGSNIFQPGDNVKIQYSGLYHPANKMAGIYNMSAYVTYNGVPNGSSLILGAGQYTFGSAPSAQAVTVTIPEDHDVAANPSIVMNKGVIQVNGYGDPIGNHRNIDPVAGRSPNFTAVAHKTYFGAIPDVVINLTQVKYFDIDIKCNTTPTDMEILFNGKPLAANEDGSYSGTYGSYSITAGKAGYRCFRHTFTIDDDAEGVQTFNVDLTEAPFAWDGKTMEQPETDNDTYLIATPSNLAWFANEVNTKGGVFNAMIVDDIDLGDYAWDPIGTSSKPFTGSITGCGHTVSGLYYNNTTAQYAALVGYAQGKDADNYTTISGLTVDGSISAKAYAGGIAGYVHNYVSIDTCANNATVTVLNTNAGGIAGFIGYVTSKVANCYNTGTIKATSNCGGIVGSHPNAGTDVKNVFNVGVIDCTRYAGGCVGSSGAKTGVENAFAIEEYDLTDGYTLVTPEQMASGEVAYKLGEPFGQKIGEDEYPVFGGEKVLFDADTDRYYNEGMESVDGIDSEESAEIEAYYNTQGLRSATPFKGINIVRMTDGSVRKIVIR